MFRSTRNPCFHSPMVAEGKHPVGLQCKHCMNCCQKLQAVNFKFDYYTCVCGKPLKYENELYSEEHKRKGNTDKADFNV